MEVVLELQMWSLLMCPQAQLGPHPLWGPQWRVYVYPNDYHRSLPIALLLDRGQQRDWKPAVGTEKAVTSLAANETPRVSWTPISAGQMNWPRFPLAERRQFHPYCLCFVYCCRCCCCCHPQSPLFQNEASWLLPGYVSVWQNLSWHGPTDPAEEPACWSPVPAALDREALFHEGHRGLLSHSSQEKNQALGQYRLSHHHQWNFEVVEEKCMGEDGRKMP
mmetsp:Transcript_15580/g.25962  ORF Transcript_15580/g.25962 Transcript_15580/m.25962 type:complete len:220 (-) Transcript_15580:106-765(-)